MARILLAGMKKYLSHFKDKKIKKNVIDKIEQQTEIVMELKSKQARLQGELRETTAQLQKELKQLGVEVGIGRGIVKMDIDQSLWIAFGITVKK
jgi:uncharacterized phage infection (PIP) family protein YhgE